MNPLLPKGNAPFNSSGPPLPEWRRFFESLAASETNESLAAQYAALAARVAVLEAEDGDIALVGHDSVRIVGNTVRLYGDDGSPGNTYYYGTDLNGSKGWYLRDLATLADVDPTTPFALGDAPVFDGTLFQPTPVLANPMTTLGDIITADTGGVPQALPIGANGQTLTVVAGEPAWATGPSPQRGITVTGGAISGPVIDAAEIIGGFAASDYTLTGNWYLWCSPTGSIELDVRATAFGAIPPNSGDSICGGNEPAVSTAISASGNYTGWSTTINRGDALSVVVNSVTDVTWFVLLLEAV